MHENGKNVESPFWRSLYAHTKLLESTLSFWANRPSKVESIQTRLDWTGYMESFLWRLLYSFQKIPKSISKIFTTVIFRECAQCNVKLSQILCLLSKIGFETLATKNSPNDDTKFSELVKKKTNRSDEGFLRIQRNWYLNVISIFLKFSCT